jgi:hypothetical protein
MKALSRLAPSPSALTQFPIYLLPHLLKPLAKRLPLGDTIPKG